MIELKQRRERVYAEFKDRVTRYVRSKISNAGDAEDVVSDVFVKVFAGLDGYDAEKASLSTWIYTITRNTVADYFRAAKRFCELPEELSASENIEEKFLNEDMLNRLADALSRLPERQRNIIVMRYYGGKTLKNIAEVTGISYSYVKLLHSDALKAMKKFLEE